MNSTIIAIGGIRSRACLPYNDGREMRMRQKYPKMPETVKKKKITRRSWYGMVFSGREVRDGNKLLVSERFLCVSCTRRRDISPRCGKIVVLASLRRVYEKRTIPPSFVFWSLLRCSFKAPTGRGL